MPRTELPRNIAGIVASLLCVVPAAGQTSQGSHDSTIVVGSARQGGISLQSIVSLAIDSVRLIDALDAIHRQTGAMIGYVTQEVKAETAKVAFHGRNVRLGPALEALLRPTSFRVVTTSGGNLLLRHGVSGRLAVEVGQRGVVAGLVTDAKTGQGLSAAEVLLEGTPWRGTTDTAGRYRIAEVTPGEYTITARRVGYAKLGRHVIVRDGEEKVDLALTPVAVKLDELVTTATGAQRRGALPNAITTIRADSVLQTAPIRNLTDLLDNRVPGLTVQHTSGAPGDPARLRLRGIGSLLGSNDPVVFVDGVRLYATQSEARSGNLTNLSPRLLVPVSNDPLTVRNIPAPSPLDQIDPNIIETIDVFKGPSAAALYGADAANGVIVITTKRGRPGPTTWDVRVTHGSTAIPGRYPLGYYNWGHSVYNNALMVCKLTNFSCIPDSLVRFQALNEPDLTILGRGSRTGLSATASGGGMAVTYSVTGTYTDEVGLLQLPAFEAERFQVRFGREAPDWMKEPHHYKTWSMMSSVTARLGAKADLTFSTMVSRSDQQRSSLENYVSRLSGTYVDRVNGVYYTPVGVAGSSGGVQSSLDFLKEYYRRTTASTIDFSPKVIMNWRPGAWLAVIGSAGLDVQPRNDQVFLPAGLLSSVDSGGISRGVGRSVVSTLGVQGMVTKPLGRSFMFQAAVGTNLTTTSTNDLVSSAVGLVPGKATLGEASKVVSIEQLGNTSVYGWYIEPRLTSSRISISTGFRLDGGSAYGTRISGAGGVGGLLGLPKLGATWTISEEPFFPFKSLFSSLRLRGSYGQAQRQPDPADRLRLYRYSSLTASSTVDIVTVGNTEIRPERSAEFEAGLDADLFDSRVSLELTGFRKTTIDALMNMTLAPSLGGESDRSFTQVKNIGNIRNNGLEFTLEVTPIQTPILRWSAQFQYYRNTNTLVKLGRGVATNKVQGVVEGYPLFGRWTRPILGYADQDGNGVLEPDEVLVGDSLVYMGSLLPAYTTSLKTNVAMFGGAIGITADFSYQSGATQLDGTASGNWVLAREAVDLSTPLGAQAAAVASASTADGQSTAYGQMQDVSTFRFNAFSLNYRAPQRAARLLRAQQLTIGVQGANLALHSTYRGKDPDVNAWSPGETITDEGQLPQPRTWQVSVSLRY